MKERHLFIAVILIALMAPQPSLGVFFEWLNPSPRNLEREEKASMCQNIFSGATQPAEVASEVYENKIRKAVEFIRHQKLKEALDFLSDDVLVSDTHAHGKSFRLSPHQYRRSLSAATNLSESEMLHLRLSVNKSLKADAEQSPNGAVIPVSREEILDQLVLKAANLSKDELLAFVDGEERLLNVPQRVSISANPNEVEIAIAKKWLFLTVHQMIHVVQQLRKVEGKSALVSHFLNRNPLLVRQLERASVLQRGDLRSVGGDGTDLLLEADVYAYMIEIFEDSMPHWESRDFATNWLIDHERSRWNLEPLRIWRTPPDLSHLYYRNLMDKDFVHRMIPLPPPSNMLGAIYRDLSGQAYSMVQETYEVIPDHVLQFQKLPRGFVLNGLNTKAQIESLDALDNVNVDEFMRLQMIADNHYVIDEIQSTHQLIGRALIDLRTLFKAAEARNVLRRISLPSLPDTLQALVAYQNQHFLIETHPATSALMVSAAASEGGEGSSDFFIIHNLDTGAKFEFYESQMQEIHRYGYYRHSDKPGRRPTDMIAALPHLIRMRR